jgi:hypothetical protein
VIALIIDLSNPRRGFGSAGTALLWKAWKESRVRFFFALTLLASVVMYAVITGPEYLMRRTNLFPAGPISIRRTFGVVYFTMPFKASGL